MWSSMKLLWEKGSRVNLENWVLKIFLEKTEYGVSGTQCSHTPSYRTEVWGWLGTEQKNSLESSGKDSHRYDFTVWQSLNFHYLEEDRLFNKWYSDHFESA